MSNSTVPPRRDDTEELAPADDAIIGRALRWSAAAVAAAGIVVGGAIWHFKRKPPPQPESRTQLTAPMPREAARAEPSRVVFTDVTRAAGIDFVHQNGAVGEKLLPETMGGGCAFFDFDADGDQDVLFVNGTWWPDKMPPGQKLAIPRLYANNGRGEFLDVTAGSGLEVPLYGMGVAVGDYNNDGLPDVYLTAVGTNRLLQNNGGGKFTDVTATTRTGGAEDDWSTAAAWFDMDNDGDLDLFVANYVRWSREIDFEVDYRLVGVGRAYGPPMNFQGAFPRLYRNDGMGRFAEISEDSGVQVRNAATGVPAAKSLGVAPVDINGDHLIDLIIANDTVPNALFLNAGSGRFKEMGAVSGIAFDSYGNTRGAMGIDAAFYRNDQALGIGIGNFANEMTALYVSSAADPTLFTDEAIAEGIGPPSRLALKFGLFFFDYDLDGWLDILTANGHLEEEINKVQSSQHYRQPAQLFWNSGGVIAGGGFVPVGTEFAGPDLFKPLVGRGGAYADMDGDGDLDVVITQIGGAPLLLRNDLSPGQRWLRFKLVGSKANRDAIGAWIHVRIGDKILRRQVMPTRGYLSQSELPVTIGLGNYPRPDAVHIIWPGGILQELDAKGLALNRLVVVQQE